MIGYYNGTVLKNKSNIRLPQYFFACQSLVMSLVIPHNVENNKQSKGRKRENVILRMMSE